MLRILYDYFDQKVKNIHDEMDLHHSYKKKSVYFLECVIRKYRQTTSKRRCMDVVTTSFQRFDVVPTSIQRRSDVVCLLDVVLVDQISLFFFTVTFKSSNCNPLKNKLFFYCCKPCVLLFGKHWKCTVIAYS